MLCFLHAEIRGSAVFIHHKSAVFNLMIDRLFKIPMSAENKLKELKRMQGLQ
jgi:hypothetical protein